MDGLMSKELNGVPFSEIMNQAVKLKTHQVSFLRTQSCILPSGRNLILLSSFRVSYFEVNLQLTCTRLLFPGQI